MYVINFFFFQEQGEYSDVDIIFKGVELCQVLVSHFVTFTEDSAASGDKNSEKYTA
jgi:hypothetical protein